MNTTQQIRLVADILEHSHPCEIKTSLAGWSYYNPQEYGKNQFETLLLGYLGSSCEIRLALAQPPKGLTLHNLDNLTAEQVGVGYRLVTKEDSTDQPHELWSCWGWTAACLAPDETFERYPARTYRFPLSVPWPKVKPTLKPTPDYIPLGPDDVPPGSVFRSAHRWPQAEWLTPVRVELGLIEFANGFRIRWDEIMDDMQILRPNSTSWQPCKKLAPQ